MKIYRLPFFFHFYFIPWYFLFSLFIVRKHHEHVFSSIAQEQIHCQRVWLVLVLQLRTQCTVHWTRSCVQFWLLLLIDVDSMLLSFLSTLGRDSHVMLIQNQNIQLFHDFGGVLNELLVCRSVRFGKSSPKNIHIELIVIILLLFFCESGNCQLNKWT